MEHREKIGAFSRAYSRGALSWEDYVRVKRRFLLETRRLLRLGVLMLVPVRFKLLIECWDLVEKHNRYEAEALQIASAKAVKAAQFLTGDKRVYKAANMEGLKTYLY